MSTAGLRAADTLTVHENDSKFLNNRNFVELEDPNSSLDIKDIFGNIKFHTSTIDLPSNRFSKGVLWVKVVLKNKTNQPFIPITIKSSVIDEFDLFYKSTQTLKVIHLASNFPKADVKRLSQNLIHINCVVLPDSLRTIYLRIKSNANAVFPIEFHSANEFIQDASMQNVATGAFVGVVAIMAVYNLLLLFIVKDRSYLYYVCYIIFLGLTQILTRGYGTNFISGDKGLINDFVIPLVRVLFGYSILMFVYEFLHLHERSTGLKRFYWILFALYTTPLVAITFGDIRLAYTLISISAFTISVALIGIGLSLYYKGFEPAKYFLFGWTFFFGSIIISIARNQGLIAYNDFTFNVILYGSALELILFSTALADKINFYRRQKNESQIASLTIALENERLITQQNIVLENKVNERTRELLVSNDNLLVSIENLKATQIKLVETEKMASLGQLTAGIAHEINNPINFVSANVKPLRLDFDEIFTLIEKYRAFEASPTDIKLLDDVKEYREQIDIAFVKQEILTLLEGIEDGAGRTREIVDSLRTFSRTDEQTLKLADVNREILAALVILRSTTPAYISVTPVLNHLEMINCYPGKLGQLFVNIITNSIQAINGKPLHEQENISITTKNEPDHITIEISDTGGGIPKEIKQRIFEPFFTTKEVGEGTGLGLSIVFGIVEKHRGNIDVSSEPGIGTTFAITIPKNLA